MPMLSVFSIWRILAIPGAIAVFALFFGIRRAIRRRGFGWISFLPTLTPAIPTAFVAYGVIRYRILHGPCLPEEGCMDEASGPMVLGILATIVVFAICLGFEMLQVRARKTKQSATGTAEGSDASRTNAGAILAVVFLGGVAAFLFPWIVHLGIMRIFDRFVLLVGFWDVALRIALCGLLGAGYAAVERTGMPKAGCAALLAGLLSTIIIALWIITEAGWVSIALPAAATVVLVILFRKPPVPYVIALLLAVIASLSFMLL